MARDTRKIGLPTQAYDVSYIIKNARIINNKVGYRDKASFSIFEMFQIRYRLYKQYYFSREVKAMDLMIRDIFLEANNYYNFSEYIVDPEKYLELKDNIIQEIQFSEEKVRTQ